MIASMTGFGRGEAESGPYRFRVELRSLNHRFFEFTARLPRELWAFEDRMRRQVAEAVHRGRVDAVVHWEVSSARRVPRVDMPLVLAYHNALEAIRRQLGLSDPVRLDHLVQRPELIPLEEGELDEEAAASGLQQATARALEALLQERRREGEALARDMRAVLERAGRLVEAIAARAPLVREEHRQRLQRRLEELLAGAPLDPVRLAMEAGLLAERLDIHEELARLQSHLDALRRALEGGSPVGRRLEFLLQEAQREITTLSAKAQDAEIAGLAVEVKVELEKLREQAQNIE